MPTFSKSKLNVYITCPEKYRLVYILRIRSGRTKPVLIEGSAIHYMVETGLLVGPEMTSHLDELSDLFWGGHPLESCGYQSRSEYLQAQKRCRDEAKQFLLQIGPLDIVHNELHLEAPLIDISTQEVKDNLLLQGYVDLIDLHQGQHRIIDIKTASRTPSDNLALIALELSIYAYLFSYPDHLDQEETVPVAFLYLVRTKEPKAIWMTSQRGVVEFVEVVRTCDAVAKAIARGVFWKNPGMHCSWCDYKCLCFDELDQALLDFGEDQVNLYYQSRTAGLENHLIAC